jgi:BirA family transcriptional regulator, biotin operon repressor / biotin---[acetyl-CoA-carboxylase] ligase
MNWPGETIWQQVMALGLPSLAAFTVEILPELDSTNSELMRRARAGRCEPSLLVAERQTAGRGRLGRAWETSQHSPSHALTFSLGLALAPRSWEGLSLVVGLSVAESLHPSLQLKWPNDVWYQGRKLGGILVETASLAPELQLPAASRWVVVGIGLNMELPPVHDSLRTAPAALREVLPESTAATSLEQIFTPLLSNLLLFEREGFAPFVGRFAQRDLLNGQEVMLSDGRSGVAQGVDEQGALLVHTSQGRQRITSQEVSVRPAA